MIFFCFCFKFPQTDDRTAELWILLYVVPGPCHKTLNLFNYILKIFIHSQLNQAYHFATSEKKQLELSSEKTCA